MAEQKMPTTGIFYERIDHGWKHTDNRGDTWYHFDHELSGCPMPEPDPEALARIRASGPVMEPMPLMVPRDNETDIDKLQAEASDLFRQLRNIRDRLNKLESQPLDVADQMTTLDHRITGVDVHLSDNIEKHCEAMYGRIAKLEHGAYNKIQPKAAPRPEIDPNRTFLTRDRKVKVINLHRADGRPQLSGQRDCDPLGCTFMWNADGRMLQGQDSNEDLILDADAAVAAVKYELSTDEFGTICLEKWPEGFVLWCGGAIVWRSWVK